MPPKKIAGKFKRCPASIFQQLASLRKDIDTPLPTIQLMTVTTLRNILGQTDYAPPFKEVAFDHQFVPVLVSLLSSQYQKVQIEAAWCLANIASSTAACTKMVVDQGAVDPMMKFLQSDHEDLVTNALWCLSNICGDDQNRDALLQKGVLTRMTNVPLHLVDTATLAWSMSNLCRGDASYALVSPCIPTLARLLMMEKDDDHDDDETVAEACWALAFCTESSQYSHAFIDTIIQQKGLCQRLVDLLISSSSRNLKRMHPLLRALGGIAASDEKHTSAVTQCNPFPAFRKLIKHFDATVRKHICWILSNVTANTDRDVERVMKAKMIPRLVRRLADDRELDIRVETMFALRNVVVGGTVDEIRHCVDSGLLVAMDQFIQWRGFDRTCAELYSVLSEMLTAICTDKESAAKHPKHITNLTQTLKDKPNPLAETKEISGPTLKAAENDDKSVSTKEDSTKEDSTASLCCTTHFDRCPRAGCTKIGTFIRALDAYIEVRCTGKCIIRYHDSCYRILTRSSAVKPQAGVPCLTPDCNGRLCSVIHREHGKCDHVLISPSTQSVSLNKTAIREKAASLSTRSLMTLTRPASTQPVNLPPPEQRPFVTPPASEKRLRSSSLRVKVEGKPTASATCAVAAATAPDRPVIELASKQKCNSRFSQSPDTSKQKSKRKSSSNVPKKKHIYTLRDFNAIVDACAEPESAWNVAKSDLQSERKSVASVEVEPGVVMMYDFSRRSDGQTRCDGRSALLSYHSESDAITAKRTLERNFTIEYAESPINMTSLDDEGRLHVATLDPELCYVNKTTPPPIDMKHSEAFNKPKHSDTSIKVPVTQTTEVFSSASNTRNKPAPKNDLKRHLALSAQTFVTK